MRPVLLTVAIGFVALAAYDLRRRWEPVGLVIDWRLVALAWLPLAAGCFVQGWGWLGLVEAMSGRRVPARRALALYLDSQLARYTPGMVGLPVVRMAGADRLGIPAAIIGSSVALEMISWTVVGSALGFSLLFATSRQAASVGALLGSWGLPIIGGSVLTLVLLLAVDRRRIPEPIRRTLALEGTGPLLPPRLPLAHVVYWASWAAHGYLLTRALADPGAAAAATGLFVVGPVAGFVALAAPAGAGVREAVLAVGLTSTVGAAPALALAVLSRGASLLADVVTWLVARALARG